MKINKVSILSPFEIPDVELALNTINTGGYPILHLGRDLNTAQKSLGLLSNSTKENFGVCYTKETPLSINLPKNINAIVFPYGMDISVDVNIEKICQIHSLSEAEKAIGDGLTNLVVKGSEGAGRVAAESSFILFQQLIKKHPQINFIIQGGAGIYSSAAFLTLGAKSVILDSQIISFRESKTPDSLKQLCEKLAGNETQVIDGFRVLIRKNSPKLPVNATCSDILAYLGGLDLDTNLIPMGQDIALSADLFKKYKTLKNLVTKIEETAYGLSNQSKKMSPICPNNNLANSLDITYPIAQGPMARVSDIPEFAYSVSESGALPFLAMSMTRGNSAQNLIEKTALLMGDRSWGVGILGFIPAEIREEQTQYILKAKPTAVLIAGGRLSLALPFEKAGIKTFIHVPSPALLDMFIKKGVKNFIFEGRESGGHIGPLHSMILWEKQITRLLKEDDLSKISVFFAGGIHDALSSAFLSIMTSSLSARGARVGVLMGSAFLYTKEAVKSGAITSVFQNKIIEEKETVILEAAQGQETRAIKSPFTSYFQDEKKTLQSKYSDSKDVWLRLEELNLGRLRIASKGIEKIGTDLIKLDNKEIAEKGLFMMGQVASMHNKVFTMKELNKNVTVDNNKLLASLPSLEQPKSDTKALDVAIVGISGIFPEAHNIEEFWRNIITNKNSITEVPDKRWNKDLYYRPESRDTDYVVSKWGGFIPTMDFDPVEFGMTPQSLASIEPVQLLSLYAAKQAMIDAGYSDLSKIDLDNTSVIFGAEGATELASSYGFRGYAKGVFGELPENLKNSLPRLTEDSFAGVLSNVISGRIANRLNLGGRNYTVDAACASSLAALDVGCQELYSNRSDMVILGGADFHNGINDFLMFSCTHALSRKGYSASFDSDSEGIALGEGIGVVVLKRVEDAERDGNKIYAVIKGIGGSSDGKSLGMTAPNKTGQAKALNRAYESSGIHPSEVGMIEAHGTGTVVGDHTELKALTDMFFESGAVNGQALLGSVKTQIGHTKCAAGIAGIIKTALSLYYAVYPPILHLNNPNPFYNKKTSPFVFNTQAGIWNSEKRVAGVSSFGFGGTNFHVVMENYKNSTNHTSTMPLWPSELFVFRGDSRDEALLISKDVKELLTFNEKISIRDIAYTLAAYNKKPIQLSIVASDSEQLVEKIESAITNKEEYGVYFTNKKEGKVAFMFSGQGSQRVNMARDLFVAFAPMRKMLEENKEYEQIIFPYATFDEKSKEQQQKDIMDTRNTQPLLGIVDYAIANFLRSIGIVPDMLAGHSYGELPALCFSGVIKPESLVHLSRERALSILNAVGDDTGKMIALNLTQNEIGNLVKDYPEVWPVNYNSHKQTVLAGSTKGLTAFMEMLSTKKISFKELKVASAFHSPLLSESENLYKTVLDKTSFGSMSIPVWSNTTSELYPTSEAEIKERLCKHLVKPVLFVQEIENMYKDGATIFVEVGPGSVLCNFTQSILGNKAIVIQTESKGVNGVTYLMHTIAKYLSTGKEVNVEKLFDQRNASTIEVNNPTKYQKKSTVWFIDGHNAVPSNGKMPAAGAYPITQPVANIGSENSSATTVVNPTDTSSSDSVVLEYLDSIKTLLQTQRDVMLGYLGAPIPATTILANDQAQPIQQKTKQTVVTNHPNQNSLIVSSVSYSPEDIKKILLDIVSEKTGYPIDVLGLDLDLEADLSIDSIKRMEIMGAIQEILNISGGFEETENAIEKIAGIKTLNGMISWMQELANGEVSEKIEKIHSKKELKENLTPSNIENYIERMSFVLEERFLDTSRQLIVEGKKFAITDDGEGYSEAIKIRLEQKGALVDLINGTEDLASYNGLIIINSIRSPKLYNMQKVLSMIKMVDLSKIEWIYSFSDILANVDTVKGINNLKNIQGFPGLIKSLAHEYPDINFRAAVFRTFFNKETLPQTVLDEILTKETVHIETIYKRQQRFFFKLKPTPLAIGTDSNLNLEENSVIIAFGGAQGITPELLSKLSNEYPCTYILVGRTEMPTAEFEKYRSLETKNDIRKYLINEEGLRFPGEIEKKVRAIYKGNQIRNNIDLITNNGSKVIYKSLDVRNEHELRVFIKEVYNTHGRIDGIIHAAGLLDDKLFANKSLESFKNVYLTKVTPLRVLLEEIRPDLQLFVMFSSVASSFGNKGQTDYASANSVFDLVASRLSKKIDARIISINWGPWKGAGMVSDTLEGEFNRRGISLIPLKFGAQYFVDELKYGKETNVLVMGGIKDVENFSKNV